MKYEHDVLDGALGEREVDITGQTSGRFGLDAKAICRRSIEIMSDGSFAGCKAVCHAGFVNHEAEMKRAKAGTPTARQPPMPPRSG
jgi:hypothetical protein